MKDYSLERKLSGAGLPHRRGSPRLLMWLAVPERFWRVAEFCDTNLRARSVSSQEGAGLRLFLIGATGGIGRAVIEQAKQRRHGVTALVRTPEKVGTLADGINVVRGNPLDADVVKGALVGHDAVLSALGPPGLGHSTVQQDGARSIVAAMQSLSMKRLLVVSAALLFKDAGVLTAILRNTLLRDVARDCAAAERIVIDTEFEWTIARPPRLTNGSLTRRYRVADGRMPEGAGALLSRADVAHFLLDEVERKQHVGQIVGLAR